MMERGLREACFWNPKGQNFQVEFTERDVQNKLQERSNMPHYFMGIEAMQGHLVAVFPKETKNERALPIT